MLAFHNMKIGFHFGGILSIITRNVKAEAAIKVIRFLIFMVAS